ncbi:hypothetical protein ADJ73_13420 [Arsenicicoccus sp. oral taxon 190]|nr:hypothetical protein ADJ73_13420 [Arsenicicoccus sp. oral taxon 190]
MPATACSRSWEVAGHPVHGTAARAGFWVALEQPGPWGRDAFTESWLDPELGVRLQSACAQAGGRLVLIRSVSDHRTRDDGAPRQVFLAGDLGGATGGPWLVTGAIVDPAELLRLDLPALLDGGPDAVLAALPGLRLTDAGILLVCTNGKRDVCCAVRGRPVALEGSRRRPGQVWECTHTGGHRFAPTGIALPSGHTIARLTGELAVAVVDAEARRELCPDTLDAAHDRGRSHLELPVQAAEGWVRARTGETALEALAGSVEAGDEWEATVLVVHRDGRRWRLRVHKELTGERLYDSCGSGPADARAFVVDELPSR